MPADAPRHYLSRRGQLISSWTSVPVPPLHGGGIASSGNSNGDANGNANGDAYGVGIGADGVGWPPMAWNPPYCLASAETSNPPRPPPKPSFVHGDPDATLPLQVWSGPLSGNGTVVAFVNAGGGTHPISATWAELGIAGLASGATCAVRDLWAGRDLPPATGSLSATVGEHDSAVFRLTCPTPAA